jgi:site-specific DNA-adenine methylase
MITKKIHGEVGSMTRVGPALSYYGGKWRAAPRYPVPEHETIIEPFAGAAGYSLLHHEHSVILCDTYKPIINAWRCLIEMSGDEIEALPDVETSTDDLEVSQQLKDLIGFWLNKGCERPRKSPSTWALRYPCQIWGPRVREKLALVADAVSHWEIHHISAFEFEFAGAATWFVDPPYQKMGKTYPHGSRTIDYESLGNWCKARKGQLIVCENEGADWLPFEWFADIRSNQANSGRKCSAEAIYLQNSKRPPIQNRLFTEVEE